MSETVLTPVLDNQTDHESPTKSDTERNGRVKQEATSAASKPAGEVLPNGAIRPDISHIETEDDEPVDNLPSEKHQRLLVEPLYNSTILERPFLAAANVGIFDAVYDSPVVPDVFLSLGVQIADDWWAKENRSYFVWEFGKHPDVVIEIVSNRKGGESSRKFTRYARLGVPYYVIFDPQHLLQPDDLRVYELQAGEYQQRPDFQCPHVGLGFTIWSGAYEDKEDRWLRWCDPDGLILPTGVELAEQATTQAEQATAQAEQERQRAERLAAKLRELGIDPEEL